MFCISRRENNYLIWRFWISCVLTAATAHRCPVHTAGFGGLLLANYAMLENNACSHYNWEKMLSKSSFLCPTKFYEIEETIARITAIASIVDSSIVLNACCVAWRRCNNRFSAEFSQHIDIPAHLCIWKLNSNLLCARTFAHISSSCLNIMIITLMGSYGT